MMMYDCCSNIRFGKTYKAFQIGFSDYMVKLEISQREFLKRFFGPEGNTLGHSFIALEDKKPIGLILGGIKEYEGIKTMRCGALCIHPEYRGKGVSNALFELHKQVALNNQCKQMSLEVIAGNDRAIKFYKNLGYYKVYDISYYSHNDIPSIQEETKHFMDIKKIDLETISPLRYEIKDVHINWQNDFDYMAKDEGLFYYGCYKNAELIGALSISANGKILFIWTKPSYRHKKVALSLMARAVDNLKLKSLSICFPNNASIEGFVNHIKFYKDEVSQYEMYLTM